MKQFVIDFEGFNISRGFCIKECSIYSIEDRHNHHFFFKSPWKKDFLSYKDRKVVHFSQINLHGIFWEAGWDKFADLLIYFKDNINVGDIIFCKGTTKKRFLEKRIQTVATVVDIEKEFKCPTFYQMSEDIINSAVISCPLSFHKNIQHCTHLKTQAFAEFLKQQQNEQMHTKELQVSQETVEMPDIEEASSH